MGLFMIILNIIQLFFMLPKIWDTIKAIMELIKLLRTKEERAAARAELRATLVKYQKTDRKNKKHVAEQGASLEKELDEMKAALAKKVGKV